MDLLGSILAGMDQPPSVSNKDKEMLKKQKEQEEKLMTQNKNELNKFRTYVEQRVERFMKDNRKHIQFPPADKVYRSVVHDVADIAGLIGMSFGQEGVDRYIVVYKKEYSPTEDEIAARRNGEEWNTQVEEEYKKRREDEEKAEEERAKLPGEDPTPKSNYKEKYVHLIGEKAALEAAKKTETNKSYGFVPSENKKDQRSIEQTLSDIQAKKRLKTSHQPSGEADK
ncbi:sperm-associated antigen 7 [Phlebotomus argentipes]|uniref:sperm-associated antigen 7 n=1 Tax=Phlebotomus argentipes TaxID=94469 RepID=UPI002893268E|nr:sperm-associated antigen 7 [Phlebotomus argentipes]